MIKHLRIQPLAFIAFTLFCLNNATALGLGNIEIKSKLGHPLLAFVKILHADGLNEDQLHIKNTVISVYKTQGIEYKSSYNDLRFFVDGEVIKIVTFQPIKEPYMNFILEITWPNGRLYKTFEVFLDPV